MIRYISYSLLLLLLLSCKKESNEESSYPTQTVTDALGRKVTLPLNIERVICSGAGSLRYLCYLEAQDRVIAVDNAEKKKSFLKSRPYNVANPQLRELPLFGEYRGRDNIEFIASLNPQPQVIFKTYSDRGVSPDELQKKTGIPVISLNYGNLTTQKSDLYTSLALMGIVLKKEDRATELISFFETLIEDLKSRTKQVTQSTSTYVGGISFAGPHGILSTEPNFTPFRFVNADNVAFDSTKRHAIISKEKLLDWNPKRLFVDLSSTHFIGEANPLHQLKDDVAYRELEAVIEGEIYGLIPYNSYTTNIGSVLANSYYVGKILHPKEFADIDPEHKADEIYKKLLKKELFQEINESFSHKAFKKLGKL